MRSLQYLPISTVLALLLSIPCQEPAIGEEGFTPLFDGKLLTGWEGNEKVFRVEKGAIVAGSLDQKIEHNEFLCTTKEYGDFELRLKAKLVGKGDNAGVQFRSQRIPKHFEVIGYQCDMGNAGGKSIWGALYDESRRKKFLVTGDHDKLTKVLRPDDFNDLVIRCEGAHIQIWVNGEKTVDYKEEEKDIPQKGKIAVQIHGGEPAEASYKDVRIKELSK